MRPLTLSLLRSTQVLPVALLCGALASAQTTYYVDDGTCPGTGAGTPASPFCSIQDAIDAASSGDTVLVLPGVYNESIRFDGKDLAVVSTRGPSTTRIQGAGSGTIVTFDSGEGNGALLEGFSIGPASGPTSRRGILCDASSPTIQGNVIQNCQPVDVGGGIACFNGADALIIGNDIRQNASTPGVGVGGGLCISGASPWIYGNVIQQNTAYFDSGGNGGGMAIFSSFSVIENNLFRNNGICDQGFGDGGALYTQGGQPLLLGNTLSSNNACTRGGAIYALGDLVIQDTILWGNTSQGGTLAGQGAEIYAGFGAQVTVFSSDVATAANAIGGPGSVTFDEATIHVDPLLSGPDFRLSAGSPAIDAGSVTRAPGGTDTELEPRILDGDLDGVQRVDIGWDEFDWSGLSVAGTPSLGQTLTFTTTAPAGWDYLLAFARTQGDVPLSPYGSILLGNAGFFLVASGTVPGSDGLTIPSIPELIGMSFHLQAFAKDPSRRVGSFSRRVDLTVQ